MLPNPSLLHYFLFLLHGFYLLLCVFHDSFSNSECYNNSVFSQLCTLPSSFIEQNATNFRKQNSMCIAVPSSGIENKCSLGILIIRGKDLSYLEFLTMAVAACC